MHWQMAPSSLFHIVSIQSKGGLFFSVVLAGCWRVRPVCPRRRAAGASCRLLSGTSNAPIPELPSLSAPLSNYCGVRLALPFAVV